MKSVLLLFLSVLIVWGNPVFCRSFDRSRINYRNRFVSQELIPGYSGPDPVAWWDATDASTISESGNLVSEWRDKSGNGNHATQNVSDNMPTWNSTEDYIGFDGSNDLLNFPNIDVKEMYVIFNIQNTTVCQLIKDNNYSNNYIFFDTNGSYGYSASIDGTVSNSGNIAFNGGSFYPLVGVGDNITVPDYNPTPRDETLLVTVRYENNVYYSRLGQGYEDNFGEMFIHEILIFDEALNTANRQSIETYLNNKWEVYE
jgi:hypothetical protein